MALILEGFLKHECLQQRHPRYSPVDQGTNRFNCFPSTARGGAALRGRLTEEKLAAGRFVHYHSDRVAVECWLQTNICEPLLTIQNRQCIVLGTSSAAPAGSSVNLTLNLIFKASFIGNRIVYMAARDVMESANTGWQPLGVWSVY